MTRQHLKNSCDSMVKWNTLSLATVMTSSMHHDPGNNCVLHAMTMWISPKCVVTCDPINVPGVNSVSISRASVEVTASATI